MARSPRFRRPSQTTILLILLLVWAVGLRVWFGSHDLQIHRFWDEKFNIPNVHAALEEGSLTPVRYAYLRLSYLPQVAVLGTLQAGARLVDPEFSWFHGEILTPGGFLVTRTIQAIIGGLSILLTFFVGRYLFSPGVGLLGAFLVAASPTHLVFSGVFKPDILAVATTLIAFLLSLRAVDQPTLGRYVSAGLGIGLAMSSKPTAGAIAIPLTIAALILGFRNWRHWLGLVSAGITSALVFLALNPYPRYLRAFSLQRKRYDQMAAQKGTLGDPLAAMRDELVTVFSWAHGVWIGAFAFAGMFFLGYLIWKHRHDGQRDLQVAMLWIYPVSFIPLYATVTQNVLPQNLLPLLPFTALAAAVLIAALWQLLATHWSWLADRRVAATVGAVLLVIVAFPSTARAYRVVVPTTKLVAIRQLAARLPGESQRLIRVESEGTSPEVFAGQPGPAKKPPAHFLLWDSPRLADLEPGVLDRSDAEAFSRARTVGLQAEFYRGRMGLVEPAQTLEIPSRPFRSWGPDLVVLLHPWQPLEPAAFELTKAAEDDWFQYRLSALTRSREVASVEFLVARDRNAKKTLRVEVEDAGVELKRLIRQGKGDLWTTDRFSLTPAGDVAVRIRLPSPEQANSLSVVVRRWRQPL
jgi:hypothetical protein